ncbi:MAG TPA: sulfurtransferase TusA family protein [Leucothrix mucor]|nr:sulfurtransferase TusA family protein [Leucothrix mucor]
MHTLDARRLLCPMPVIRVQQKIETLKTGDRLEAICTDPGVLHDIPAWAKVHGHKTIETRTEDYEFIVVIEVGASDD